MENLDEKAKRIGVPVIPASPPGSKFPEANPTVAICGACGMEMKQIMMMSCQRKDCPCFRKITF